MKLGYNPENTIPRDITAKKVVYDAGDHYNPEIKSDKHLYSTCQPPIRNLNTLPYKVKKDPSFQDLTGYKIGYFTVIGMFETDLYDKWVMRCSCGNYEVRRAKTLKKIKDQVDQNRCQSCVDLERLRNKDYWQKNGLYPWQKKKTLSSTRLQKLIAKKKDKK